MYNANYMDGVPVKIAEKYKSPPSLYKLPQPLVNRLNFEENFYWNCPAFSCDLSLNKKALTKIEQWKRIRQRNKEQRRERISRRDDQRKREDEDRQKNLLYSVSYPSTDDLSSEEEEGKVESDPEYQESVKSVSESRGRAPRVCVPETANSFHNILQPTVLSSNSCTTGNSGLTPLMNTTYENKISSSFNYKDFEVDTSSPFDSIELKTINDLDVLAQVLHNTQIKSSSDEKLNENVAMVSSESLEVCSSERKNKQLPNDSLIATDNIPKPNNSLPIFSYDLNSQQAASTQLRDHNLISVSAMHSKANLSPFSLSPLLLYNGINNSEGYYNYQYNNCDQSSKKIDSVNTQSCDGQALMYDQSTKSKSVPDILKELREEIKKSEIRKYKNCSYDIDNTKQHIDDCMSKESTVKTKDTANEDILSHLDSKTKQLVEQISAMGFPLKRVARIVQLVGADDKKVVEHLIPLSELVDLGFEESKISDALIRNENNKNKALDDLIS